MKRYAFLTIIMLAIITFASGSSWVSRYNGPGNADDDVVAIALDSSNNVYVAGTTYSNDTSYDYTTVKYDANGNLLWEAHYNGPSNSSDFAKAMVLDSSGNVYVTGYSWDDVNQNDYATVKYSSEGVQLWASRYNYSDNDNDLACAIAVDGSGNVYVTGSSYSYSTSQDYATVKYNSSGVQQWVKRYDGTAHLWDEAKALVIDGSSNVYVTGRSYSGTSDDFATLKYNSIGTLQWGGAKRYNGPGDGDDSASAIVVDSSGNVYVTGRSYSGTSDDFATLKYNSSGTLQWGGAALRYNGPSDGYDGATDIKIDSLDNVYITGYSWDDDTSGDFLTIKYNSGGTKQWEARYNGPANGYDSTRALLIDGSYNVYVTGQSYGSDAIQDDYATIKYDSGGVEQWAARYNGSGHNYDIAVAIAIDSSGNIYITGNSVGSGTGADFLTIKNPNEVGYCMGPMASDLDNDCKVDFSDFSLFVLSWLQCNYEQPEFCW